MDTKAFLFFATMNCSNHMYAYMCNYISRGILERKILHVLSQMLILSVNIICIYDPIRAEQEEGGEGKGTHVT